MKDKLHNKQLLITVLILLIFCAVYLAYDVAAGATPVLSFLFPSGAVLSYIFQPLSDDMKIAPHAALYEQVSQVIIAQERMAVWLLRQKSILKRK